MKMRAAAVTRLLLMTQDEAPAAMADLPDSLLMVAFPGVPDESVWSSANAPFSVRLLVLARVTVQFANGIVHRLKLIWAAPAGIPKYSVPAMPTEIPPPALRETR